MKLLAILALALALTGCAASKAYTLEGDGYACDLGALASVSIDRVNAGADGYCAAQIPGGGPGVLVGFRGQVYAIDIKPGETPAQAQARALTWLDAKESPSN